MFQLMNWQSSVVDHFKQNPRIIDYVVIAGTGCGKTHLGAECVKSHIIANPKDLIVIGVPYRGIKRGWTHALRKRGIEVADKPSTFAMDTQAVITTYAGAGAVLRYAVLEMPSRRVMFVFDEFHHLEETNSWAAPFLDFPSHRVSRRLLLSGTPWHERGDLPSDWVRYDDKHEAIVPDPCCRYTYGQNVNEEDEQRNTVRVEFEHFESRGLERYNGGDPVPYSSTCAIKSSGLRKYVEFADYDDLMTCDGLPQMLQRSDTVLQQRRAIMPDAGGIVFVSSQDSGRAVQQWFREVLRKHAHLIISEDPLSHRILEEFRCSADQWIISVDMVSEGVDIPRLRVVCDLSDRSTKLHIIQRWGRVLRRARYSDGRPRRDDIEAYIIHIDHPALMEVAALIEQDITHHRREATTGAESSQPPQSTRERLSQEGDSKGKMFRGQSIDDDAERVANNILRLDYNSVLSDGLGLAGALNLAKYLLKTGSVTSELMDEWTPDTSGDDSKPGDEREDKEDIVACYTSITNHVMSRVFDGDAKATMRAIGDEQGIRGRWDKDRKTTAQLRDRLNACKRVYERFLGPVDHNKVKCRGVQL